MEPDARAELIPDTGPRACVAATGSGLPPQPAASPKVTFHSLDIFLPRSKLRCNAPARHHTRHARIF